MDACREARESDQQRSRAANRIARLSSFWKSLQGSQSVSSKQCSDGLFRLCPPRNLSQNRHKDQVALITAIVAVRVFVQIRLQVLLADGMIDAADPTFNERPKALDRIGVSIAHHVDFRTVMNAFVMVSLAKLFDA